jgi:transcriptional regulator with XRE-family HTH domain
MRKVDVLLLAETREAVSTGAASKLREAARLSQADVARAIGVSPSTVSRWEAGERLPRGKAARRYAEFLNALRARTSAEAA